jgi:hypothetical protein
MKQLLLKGMSSRYSTHPSNDDDDDGDSDDDDDDDDDDDAFMQSSGSLKISVGRTRGAYVPVWKAEVFVACCPATSTH